MTRKPTAFLTIVTVSLTAAAHAGDTIPIQTFGRVVDCFGGRKAIQQDDGLYFAINNADELTAGQHVNVSGMLGLSVLVPCATQAEDAGFIPVIIAESIAPVFRGPGQLVDNPDCNLFRAADGTEFALENTGELLAGESVFVQGDIEESTTECGSLVLPSIINNEIGQLTSATGRIVNRGACTLLETKDSDRFIVDNRFNFRVDEWVTITGAAAEPCVDCCGSDNVFVVRNNTMTAAVAARGRIKKSDCGLIFEPTNASYAPGATLGIRVRLDDFDTFTAGDRVFVTGAFDADCDPDNDCYSSCITTNTIDEHVGACGILETADQTCANFTAEDGRQFVIENADEFSAGQSVFVSGALAENSPCAANTDLPVLRYNLISPCVSICGTIELGFECAPLFAGDNGGVASLGNTAPFTFDGYVEVTGGLEFACILGCPFGCVRDYTIRACITGDGDGDRDVDLIDAERFTDCVNGPNVPFGFGCRSADLDRDNDVDFADYQIFQQTFGDDFAND